MNTQFAFHDLKIPSHPETSLAFHSLTRSAISALDPHPEWVVFFQLSKGEDKICEGLRQKIQNMFYVLKLLR